MARLIQVVSVSARGAHGTWLGPVPAQIRCRVTGDEGAFAVEARRLPDGTWRARWPAELAPGNYTVHAQLWSRVARDAKALSVAAPPDGTQPSSDTLPGPNTFPGAPG